MAVTFRIDGAVGHVVVDNPPVNAIGRDVRQSLLDAAQRAEAERLERVILSGAGRGFAAGADAREFDAPPRPPHLPEVLSRIEQSPVPWIAAVHGVALGGGAELMLACRYRVARADATIGFPEVNLGVVPGAGGTQRLPRLVGTERALELIATGKPMTGAAAQAIGLVDGLDDDPVTFAEQISGEILGTAVAVGDLEAGSAPAGAFEAARAAARRKMRGQNAPPEAIDLLELARTASLQDALRAERQVFLRLRDSDQARALRHVFFAERAARPPGWLLADPAQVGTVAVAGGGTMGAAIAYALLNAGLRVTLLEADADAATRARAAVDTIFAASLDRGLIDAAGAASRRAGLVVSDDVQAASGADLAIEAVFENMEVKKAALTALQSVMPAGAVLATNTSYLDIDEMALCLVDPSRLVGLHFFAPAHVMKLLEIVRGGQTSDRALATGYWLARRLRKIPVLAGVCDGFIGNRILSRYREAADFLLLDGATPWEVDQAMVDFGYAMGPYETQDLSGLDIACANRRRQDAARDPARRYVSIQDRLVDNGRLGRKSGAGWYSYRGGGKVIDPLVEDQIREQSRLAGLTRRIFSAAEIRHRLLLAMVNEAADILHEGIARSASDIDLVTIHGYGFPRWRGGLMHHADRLGVPKLLEGLQALCDEDALVWRPSSLIRECAKRGLRLADWPSG